MKAILLHHIAQILPTHPSAPTTTNKMKYSTAAFTFALDLLAANNDVADAGGFNLRGRGAINRRRARHLKGNQDTTGDDALNRATPTVAKEEDIIITDDTDIVGEESVTSIKSEKSEKGEETTVDGVDHEATTEEEKATKSHKGAAEVRADGDEEEEEASSQSSESSDEEELEELIVEDGVEGEGKVRIFYTSRVNA